MFRRVSIDLCIILKIVECTCMGSTRNIRYGAGAGPSSVFEYEYSTSRGPIKVQREGLNLTGAIKKFIPFTLPIEILRPPLVSRLPAQKLLSPHTETQAKKHKFISVYTSKYKQAATDILQWFAIQLPNEYIEAAIENWTLT
jgi:hypothetical protein